MKFIKKLRAAIDSSKIGEPFQSDTYIEDIMNQVEGNAFAISETNVMYSALSELAGYHYFKTIIIGTFQIKTFKGAKLIINGVDFKLELKSDMVELESEVSNGLNRSVSRIDFEINSEDVAKISRTTVESVELVAKKNHIKFFTIEGNDDDLIEKHPTEEEPKIEEGQHEEEE